MPRRGEVLSGSAGGRVVEVRAREGDEVRRGDLLIRLETERLDNEIARQRRILRAAEEELETLVRQAALTLRQFEATRAKAEAELDQAREQVRREREHQKADIRLVQVELEAARDEEGQLRVLVGRHAAPRADLIKAMRKTREVQEKSGQGAAPGGREPGVRGGAGDGPGRSRLRGESGGAGAETDGQARGGRGGPDRAGQPWSWSGSWRRSGPRWMGSWSRET